MADDTLVLNALDHKRLCDLFEFDSGGSLEDRAARRDLLSELRRGRVVRPQEIPPDVVTMRSQVRLIDVDTGEELVYTLVYPQEADLARGRISVLAPIGTAILGERVGKIVAWPVPAGIRHLRIEQILYQPEASGELDR